MTSKQLLDEVFKVLSSVRSVVRLLCMLRFWKTRDFLGFRKTLNCHTFFSLDGLVVLCIQQSNHQCKAKNKMSLVLKELSKVYSFVPFIQ